jgi:hypothetical protein
VEEKGGDSRKLWLPGWLAGQEKDGSAWAVSTMALYAPRHNTNQRRGRGTQNPPAPPAPPAASGGDDAPGHGGPLSLESRQEDGCQRVGGGDHRVVTGIERYDLRCAEVRRKA